MKKGAYKFAFILAGILCFNMGYGQSKTIDSLRAAFISCKEDTSKIKTLNKLAAEFGNYDLDSAITICERAVKLAGKGNYEKNLAQTLNQLAGFYFSAGDLETALTNYKGSLSHWEKMSRSTDKATVILGKTGMARVLSNIGNIYTAQAETKTGLIYYERSLKIAKEVDNKSSAAYVLSCMGSAYDNLGSYDTSIVCFERAKEIAGEIKDLHLLATVTGNIGKVFYARGNYTKSLEYFFEALKLSEQENNQKFIAVWCEYLGNVYTDQNELDKALKFYFKGLKIAEDMGDKVGVGTTLGNIGTVYYMQANYTLALGNFFKALKTSEEVNDQNNVSAWLGDIGTVYFEQGDSSIEKGNEAYAFTDRFPKALFYFDRALNLSRQLGIKEKTALWLISIGTLHNKAKNYKQAEISLKEGLALADSLESIDNIKNAYEQLSQIYDKTGRYAQALEHYKKYIAARDSMNNEETQKKQVQTEMQYEFDKKEAAARLEQEKKDAIAAADSRKQKIIIYSVTSGLILLMMLAVVILRNLRLNQRKNRIISMQKEAVERQKELVEAHQKEILDSIHYARRIQVALLPSEKYFEKKFSGLQKK